MSILLYPLQMILCVLQNLALSILAVIVMAVNGIIVSLAALITTIIATMPNMPSLPSIPSEVSTGLTWVAWVLPTGTIYDILVFYLTAWLVWQVVLILLRWAKAPDE